MKDGENPVMKSDLPVRPIGEMVLFETVSRKETKSGIALPEGADVGETEVYVRALGKKVNPEAGVKIGDRVMLSRHHNGLQEVKNTLGKKFSLCHFDAIVAVVE